MRVADNQTARTDLDEIAMRGTSALFQSPIATLGIAAPNPQARLVGSINSAANPA